MRCWMILCLPLLAVACAPSAERRPGTVPMRSESPAPNTGLMRPEAGIDPGIRAPLPNRSPTTTPVIPPNPGIQAR